MRREIRVEQIVGRKVWARDGQSIGRIEEVRVEQQGDTHVVTEYLVGTTALLERLSLGTVEKHEGRVAGGYRVWWHQMDLTDPTNPRLSCEVADLRELRAYSEADEREAGG